jgi:DNA-binding transcriptional LysR family regulator
MKNDLESIAVFVSVVREGSFSAAARRMGFSPSAISKRIAGLEQRIGVALLARTTRKISLTDAGREFYDRCAHGLSEIAAAEESVGRFGRQPHGVLRIKAPQAFGRLHVAPKIPLFLERHPQIRVDFVAGPGVRGQSDEAFDIWIASSDPPNGDLVSRTLAPIERVTCAAPSYFAKRPPPQSADDLADHNCLIFAGSDSVENEWVLRTDAGLRRVRVDGNFRTDDAEAMRAAVLAGVGVAHMPTFIVGPAIASGALIPIFRDRGGSGGAGASMKAYYGGAKYRLPKVRAFVDFLVASFRDEKWSS